MNHFKLFPFVLSLSKDSEIVFQQPAGRRRQLMWALMFLIASPWISAGAEPAGFAKPEKGRLEVGTAGSGTTSLPLFVALEAGYFAKRGLSVSVNQVGATVAVQGIISGTIDIYQGGTAPSPTSCDVIYVAAAVDRNSLILFGQKGSRRLRIFAANRLRRPSLAPLGNCYSDDGKKMAWKSAKISSFSITAALRKPSHFSCGQRRRLIITPPQTELAKQQGFPLIIDYFKEGLKITGPGTAVTREFFQKYPNTIKAYLMAYLDGLKRAIDDETYAKQIESKYTKISDLKILNENYQQGLRVWNKDMTVDPAAIRVVLDDSSDPKAKSADPKRFYDNSLIEAVNREYASKLFPGEVR